MDRKPWFVLAFLLGATIAGCGGDDDGGEGEGEGEGEEDSVLDIAVSAAEGVLTDVKAVRGYYIVAGATSCDGLTSRRVPADEFTNRHDPVFTIWSPPGTPHITTSIHNGSSEVLIEAYDTEGANGRSCTADTVATDCAAGERCVFATCIPEPAAAGCKDDVYVAPGQRFDTSIQIRLNP
jgi:hypothetical protein